MMDQQDGMDLGHSLAQYVQANSFQAVPEPGTLGLVGAAFAGVAVLVWRRRRK